MKKLFSISVVLVLFTISLAAQSAYQFSGFGGGLPSSVVVLEDEQNSEPAEVTELSADGGSSSSGLSKSDKIWITAGVVISVALIAGTVFWLTQTTPENRGECFDECTDDTCDACNDESCWNDCSNTGEEDCSDAVSATCSGDGLSLFTVLPKFPVYVP